LTGADTGVLQPDVTLVVPRGTGSMQALAGELAARLPVRRLNTDIATASAEQYNLDWRAAQRAARSDVAFLRTLARLRGLVHFPSHHLARYGALMRQPFVVTVHDLIRQFDRRRASPYIHRPTRRDRAVLALDVAGIRRAAAIIAVSEATKRDLVAHLGIDPERVHVIAPGIDRQRFHPVAPAPLPYRYVLCVGSEHPRKNLPALLGALAALKADARHRDLRLVKVGAAGGPEAPYRARTLAAVAEHGLDGDVHLTGQVSHADLLALYAGAQCLVQPSLYEGFGLPPLEAMACGCPVIVSDRGALPETAGPAALVSAPDADALAGAIGRVLGDGALRARLVRDGRAHVTRYDWAWTAAATLEVYRGVVRRGLARRW
jgi:glycosyltransferase involved in cell wall biosynthesis